MTEREDILNPSGRLLLSEALRPPRGYDLDIAVGTTYSLDLNSLLLVPFILSSQSASSSDVDTEASSANLARKLAALRRYADRLTVFARAGNIHTPATYQAFHTFLEHLVVQVTVPLSGHLFHPKIWALRFTTPGHEPLHRLVVSSRNITADTSSDTILTCDQAAPGADHALDAAPLVVFLRALTQLPGAPAGLALARRAQVDSLVASLATIPGFEVPEPFESGALVPLGLPDANLDTQWPIPRGSSSWGIMSLFLDAGHIDTRPCRASSFLSPHHLGSRAL